MSNGHHAADGTKVILAYDRWCEIMGVNSYHTFWKFLKTDDTMAMSAWRGSYYIHPDGLRRLDMLLSLNWKAYITAHKVRTKNEGRVRKTKRRPKGR